MTTQEELEQVCENLAEQYDAFFIDDMLPEDSEAFDYDAFEDVRNQYTNALDNLIGHLRTKEDANMGDAHLTIVALDAYNEILKHVCNAEARC